MAWIVSLSFVVLIWLAAYDVTQRKHSILRIFPIVGHFRHWLEHIGPEPGSISLPVTMKNVRLAAISDAGYMPLPKSKTITLDLAQASIPNSRLAI